MPKVEVSNRAALYPVPVVLVTCRDAATKKPNIITVAWCGVASTEPPIIAISIRPSRFSYSVIRKTGELVINIPTAGMFDQIDRCGTSSGKDADKFALCGLHPVPGCRVSAPLIRECPVNIECTIRDVTALGSHDMFLCTVVAVHADDAMLDSAGAVDFARADPIVYNQGQYWGLGKMLGRYGCSRR